VRLLCLCLCVRARLFDEAVSRESRRVGRLVWAVVVVVVVVVVVGRRLSSLLSSSSLISGAARFLGENQRTWTVGLVARELLEPVVVAANAGGGQPPAKHAREPLVAASQDVARSVTVKGLEAVLQGSFPIDEFVGRAPLSRRSERVSEAPSMAAAAPAAAAPSAPAAAAPSAARAARPAHSQSHSQRALASELPSPPGSSAQAQAPAPLSSSFSGLRSRLQTKKRATVAGIGGDAKQEVGANNNAAAAAANNNNNNAAAAANNNAGAGTSPSFLKRISATLSRTKRSPFDAARANFRKLVGRAQHNAAQRDASALIALRVSFGRRASWSTQFHQKKYRECLKVLADILAMPESESIEPVRWPRARWVGAERRARSSCT
jgi:hypothetical protein